MPPYPLHIEIFTKTTSKRSGIIELASNDNNLNEEQNLNNLLNSIRLMFLEIL